MADETLPENAAKTETPDVALTEKKTRKPRAQKAVAEPTTSDVSAPLVEKPAKKTRAKRGSKIMAAKPEKSDAEPKKVVSRTPNATVNPPVSTASVEVVDDIADLIKLEEENRQLRKQLSEKLRAENADLRKRLGQG